jgi:hypothetical protein
MKRRHQQQQQQRQRFLFLALVAVLGVGGAGRAIPATAAGFPASGQTTAYTADKNDRITGAVAVADDGSVQAGATLSYTDNGDGTVTDNDTGLMWEKKSDDGGLHDKDNGYPWSGSGSQQTIWDWLDAVNAEGGTGFAGHRDWRIPNIKEMQSLANYQSAAPMTSAAFNSGCVAGVGVLAGSCTLTSPYWSSTTWPTNHAMAAGVSFFDGSVGAFDKSTSPHVRAVRGGLTSPVLPATGQLTAYTVDKNDGIAGAVAVPDDGAVRAGAAMSFTDNGDGTVTDNVTGLVWEKKSDDGGLHDKDTFLQWTGNGAQDTIWDWLDKVNAAAFAGNTDWRIPNLREQLSITDFEGTVPAAFNNGCVAGVSVLTGSCTKNQPYWTSTSQASSLVGGNTICAWYVGTAGDLSAYFKSSGYVIRAVRAGTP